MSGPFDSPLVMFFYYWFLLDLLLVSIRRRGSDRGPPENPLPPRGDSGSTRTGNRLPGSFLHPEDVRDGLVAGWKGQILKKGRDQSVRACGDRGEGP